MERPANEDEPCLLNRFAARKIIWSGRFDERGGHLISTGNGAGYELKSRMPNINSANVLATMSKFKMISPTYSPTYCSALEENMTRSAFGLIA